MNDKAELRKRLGGITANAALIPILIIFVIIHMMIIINFLSANILSNQMSAVQRSYSYTYIAEANSIIGGSSLLSETASNFILAPVNESGELNLGPLMAFAQEYPSERRPAIIREHFKEYNISDEARVLLNLTCDNAQALLDAQLHALALMDSVYHLPDNPSLAAIPLPELTAEEQRLPDEAKVGLARQLVFSGDYQIQKAALAENSNNCLGKLRGELAAYSQEMSAKIEKVNDRMWICTLLALALVFVVFIGAYDLFVSPIKQATKRISDDETLSEKKGVREFRIMSYAYNSLLARRNAVDSILRSAASTDTLTGLANRYAFESYSLDKEEETGPLGVVFFDVNYLKEVNDTKGHSAGDQLLRDSADCIVDTFGKADSSNCFRVGGDEFITIMPRVETLSEMEEIAKHFLAEQRAKDISIAYGLAFTEDISTTTIKDLCEKADHELYKCKEIMHSEREAR